MARLSEQMRYFINKKITEDSNWRDVVVVFSGHEVLWEGEHKTMEYIRLSWAQPHYNPNIRHCLYGLDAKYERWVHRSGHQQIRATCRRESTRGAAEGGQGCDAYRCG